MAVAGGGPSFSSPARTPLPGTQLSHRSGGGSRRHPFRRGKINVVEQPSFALRRLLARSSEITDRTHSKLLEPAHIVCALMEEYGSVYQKLSVFGILPDLLLRNIERGDAGQPSRMAPRVLKLVTENQFTSVKSFLTELWETDPSLASGLNEIAEHPITLSQLLESIPDNETNSESDSPIVSSGPVTAELRPVDDR